VTFIFVRELGDDVIVVNSQFNRAVIAVTENPSLITMVTASQRWSIWLTSVSTYHFFDVQLDA